ncbi:MAG: glycosyl hydrolase [Zunongwangia sp.]|uniref:beta-glucosidase n=1 Tax=Zunongwangia profunda TaxID=398743 RepID=A0A3D5IWM0_9FLAO|nr:glycoside hydrolase family 3 N-terminal domain-containing protein [Zunongwangia profunda]MAO37930.1 glycosyl hydrolase [Zunongwangia sp.]MAS70762.1 glycosyl hydrolase [Zunongwangia sp.]MCC4226804.1 glycoside hydrolase family 3 C-terminal domain-containing protein [Zunongwangia profunda]HCV79632.1 glycosyl hydrolase [Zunongwangia profunda]
MRIYKLLIILLITSNLMAQKDVGIEHKVDSLLNRMTLLEKIGQMNQLSADDMETNYGLIRKGLAGSVLSITDPEVANKAQRIALEESRLGIPIIIGRDVIHGFKTIFPIPLGQAASFDEELVQQGARIAAVEASSVGIRWTFAPMMDITHDPRWGRIAESLGEDPLLASKLAVAMVKGFQGDNLSNPNAIAACAKHFAGYGAAEGGRDYNTTSITERGFRNLYLQPFEAAVKEAHVATIMSAFHANDGIPATANRFLLKDVLRDEWGFDGFVVSDWASVTEMIDHGYSENEKQAAMQAINAGVDMEMVSGTYLAKAEELLKENKISINAINDAVRNILRIKFRLGLFDNPYASGNTEEVFYAQDHLEKAKLAAEESIVMLKNKNSILPFKNVKDILVVGPLADKPHEQMGTWVFDGESSHTQTPLKALQKQYGKNINIEYVPVLEYSRDSDTSTLQEAIAKAAEADVILAFVGEESILSGEAHSLSNLHLQGAQSEMIEKLYETRKPLVTVVMAGRPLAIKDEIYKSKALLYAWHPGTMGGPAIVDLLFGKANPSGKLPMTFPKNAGQIPMYYNHLNTGRPATGNDATLENIPVGALQTSLGNRSVYLDSGHEPLFPFGFGLSFTQFKYGEPQLKKDTLEVTDILDVSVELSNVGECEGTEVVQLYTRDLSGSIARPVRELRDFQRVSLKAGESKIVTFKLPVEQLSFWNIDMEEKVEVGKFQLWISKDSNSGEPLNFEIR